MTKYAVFMTAQCEYRIEVEAGDEDEALDKAFEFKPDDVCANCAGMNKPWTFTVPNDHTCWDAYEVSEVTA